MLTSMHHLTLINTDLLTAAVTVLGEAVLKALTTVGFVFLHYITLTTKMLVAMKTREMVEVPAVILGFCAFLC